MGYKDLINTKKASNVDTELYEKFLNAANTSTLQKEYYTKPDEQAKKVFKLHDEMISKHRDLYTTAVLLPINDLHKQLIIKNIITNKDATKAQIDFENNLILDSLRKIPTNRAYKTFDILMRSKINNTRLRWLMRQFLRERRDVVFESVKYKRLMKAMLKHAHINSTKILKDKEIEYFLFDKEDKVTKDIYKNYFKAKKDKTAMYKLPASIAEGFKSLHKVSDKDFLKNIKGNLTKTEKRRVQNRAEKAGVKVEYSIKGDNPVNILKFLRVAENRNLKNDYKEFDKACKIKAEKLFEYFEFDNVKIVLDNSASMYGSDEKKNHPISVAEACAHVLKYLSDETEVISVPNKGDLLVNTDGETKIAEGLIKDIEGIDIDKDNIIFIISDGYENAPAGLSDQIILAFKKKLDKKEKTIIIHLNPVFAPEAEDVKKLSDQIQTYGIRDTRQLFLVLLLAIIRNKKDKKIREIVEGMKKKVEIRKRKKKKVKK